MAIPIVNARDIRNNWGMNGGPIVGNDTAVTSVVNGLNYLNTRLLRLEFSTAGLPHAQNATDINNKAQALGIFDPNVRFSGLVDGYFQSASFNSWTANQIPNLQFTLALKMKNTSPMFSFLEGPNEFGWTLSQGGGYVYPDGTTQQGVNPPFVPPGGNYTTIPATVRTGYNLWSSALSSFRSSNTALMNGINLIGASLLENTGNFLGYTNPTILNTGNMDYFTIHWYGPENGDTSLLLSYYNGAKTAEVGGSKQGCMTEAGTNMLDNGMSADGITAAWLTLLQFFDFFALGGKMLTWYTMGTTDDDVRIFQWFNGFATNVAPLGQGHNFTTCSAATAQPRAKVMRNLSALLSLGNNYSDARNTSDTGIVTPGYTGAGFNISVVSGTPNWSATGNNAMIMPKSDGSTMIAIWRASSNLNVQTGVTDSVTVNVNLGASLAWKVWDPTGGTGGNTRTIVDTGATNIASGTGSVVPLTLFGVPLIIELTVSTVTSAPATPATPTLGATTATSQVINWTTVLSGTAAVATYITEQSLNGTTWTPTPPAGNAVSQPGTYTFNGLTSATPYFFRVGAINAINGANAPVWSAAVPATTAGSSGGGTPVIVQTNTFRSDAPGAAASINLGFATQPLSTNSIWVTFNGYSGGAGGTNSNAIIPPTGSTVVSGPNYDPPGNASEVTYAWIVPYTSTNSWTFSNFDNLNNAGWKIFEVAGYVTYDTSHGVVSSETATSVSWPLTAPTFSNALRLTLLSLQFDATIGTPSANVAVIKADPVPAVNAFHQGILLSETVAVTTPSLALTGGTAGDTSTYLNIQMYGGALPLQVTGLTTSGLNATGVTLAWVGQTGINSYTIQRSTTSATAGFAFLATVQATNSNYTDNSLVANTDYWYKVASNNSAGQGPFSSVVTIHTPAASTLLVVQSAQGSDLNAVGTVTATMQNPTKVGNFLITYVSMAGLAQNLALTNPAGTTLISNASNSDSYAIMWTQTITAAATSYTWTGYADLASISVVEVQGVTSVFGSGSGTAIFTDNVSTSIPVVIPGTTPNLSILAVGMDIGPDSWGTMPANTTLLQQILSVPPNTIAYHQASLFQLSSVGTSGTRVFPFTSSFTQAAGPLYSEIELSGAVVAPTPPGPTTLSFVSATTSSITLSRSTATGTVSAYTLVISTTANMLNGQAYDMPLTNLTITTRPTAVGGGPLVAGTTYFFTVQAFNGPSTGGPVSAVFSATTLLGSTLRPVLIGGKPLLIGGKIVVA